MIANEETIWFPEDELYRPRMGGGYSLLIAYVRLPQLTELVQKRAEEDGEWTIAQGLVAENIGQDENEAMMRKMMAFVSNVKNISQCLEHILAEGKENERDVDWACRELATASKFMRFAF